MFESHDDAPETLPTSVVTALRGCARPRAGRDAALDAIMAAVRVAPAPRARTGPSRLLTLRPMRPRWALRPGVFSPAGAALAACLTMAIGWLGSVSGLRPATPVPTTIGGVAPVRTVAPALGGAAALRDSLLGNALVLAIRDTLRVVRFVLEAPAAQRVALIGDFTAWGAVSVPLHRGRAGWTADVPLRSGRHHYGFVVNDSQWVGSDRAGMAARFVPAESIALAPPRAAGDTI